MMNPNMYNISNMYKTSIYISDDPNMYNTSNMYKISNFQSELYIPTPIIIIIIMSCWSCW